MGLILLASVAVMALGNVIDDDVGFIPAVSPNPFNIEYDAPDTCWSLASLGSSQYPDGHSFSTEDDSYLNQPAKDVRIGCPDTHSDGFVSLLSDNQSSLFVE